MARGKYQAKRSKRRLNPGFFILIAVMLLLVGIVAFILSGGIAKLVDKFTPSSNEDNPFFSITIPQIFQPIVPEATTETTVPATTQPYISATASIGVTGDIMGHMPVINAGKTANGYDYAEVYQYIKPYYERYDVMVANLEVNLGGPEAGPYQGYPTFNSPDGMAKSLKDAGVDMVLTANNHSYDIGHNSFIRTQNTLNEMELDYLGTRLSVDEPAYTVRDVNGIKIGMVCYTYETGDPSNPRKQLNGIPMSEADSALISSFNYNDLDGFYAEVETTLSAMEAEGAQASMVFIHWGDEYALSPNSNQKAIAQQLCELGVDVIVGGHPHVIEPFTTLTSQEGNTTYCIYSVGNAISNQRTETLSDTTRNAPYTEDGMIFGVTFNLWNDGRLEISEIDILPTWVNKESKGGRMTYSIIPLDMSLESWTDFDVGSVSKTYASYERTMSIVGDGLNECREALSLPTVSLTAKKD